MSERSFPLAIGWLLWAAVTGWAAAAPLSSTDNTDPAAIQGAEAEPAAVRSGATGTRPSGPAATTGVIDGAAAATDVPTSSKTIELLLEMQGKNPGLAAGEVPKAEMPTARKAAAPAPNATELARQPFGAADPGNPFGGAQPMPGKPRPASEPQTIEWSEGLPSRFGGGGGGLAAAGGTTPAREPYGRPAASSADDDARWLIPRSVVRFVRENRDMVILGCLAVLGLLWGGTAMSQRRRK